MNKLRCRVDGNQTAIVMALRAKAYGIPEPVGEHRFHPVRRWRFDWAWIDAKVALEVQGGLFVQGRHSRGAALMKEHEKLNAAAALGWRVMFCTPQQLRSGEVLEMVKKALGVAA